MQSLRRYARQVVVIVIQAADENQNLGGSLRLRENCACQNAHEYYDWRNSTAHAFTA
jgi:hypothetical protein